MELSAHLYTHHLKYQSMIGNPEQFVLYIQTELRHRKIRLLELSPLENLSKLTVKWKVPDLPEFFFDAAFEITDFNPEYRLDIFGTGNYSGFIISKSSISNKFYVIERDEGFIKPSEEVKRLAECMTYFPDYLKSPEQSTT